MKTKRQYFEHIKLLTQAGKHLEAQALYEQLIDRKGSASLIAAS